MITEFNIFVKFANLNEYSKTMFPIGSINALKTDGIYNLFKNL